MDGFDFCEANARSVVSADLCRESITDACRKDRRTEFKNSIVWQCGVNMLGKQLVDEPILVSDVEAIVSAK